MDLGSTRSIHVPCIPGSGFRSIPGQGLDLYLDQGSNLYLRWNLKNLSRGLNPPKSAKPRFKLSAGLSLETFDTILSGTNHI